MACFHPLQAWRTASGEVVFVERGDVVKSLLLPCGRCQGCRLERSRQWSVRVMHEAMLYERNCFVTLTYDDEHLPANRSIQYEDFQKFMKRLRWFLPFWGVRYFACGEYGEALERPHFHAALFNIDFAFDRKPWRKSRGFQVYRSAFLEEMWKHGLSEVGILTQQSAAYIARYAMKKVNGDGRVAHYGYDAETGEVRQPECLHMSLKPGIGADWFRRYGQTDVYPHDRVVVKGVVSRPPRFYDKLQGLVDPVMVEELKVGRDERARERYLDNTEARLLAKETVSLARVKFFKRELK